MHNDAALHTDPVGSHSPPPEAPLGIVHAPGSPLASAVAQCRFVAPTDAPVLLLGEAGTGKEVFARSVHLQSARAAGPFVAVNCGAIPANLLEEELFGRIAGADRARNGRVAAAHGGTLFLDDVSELPASLQVKLLRLLQERSYEPVGSAETARADVRLVAATPKDLESEVIAGRFRRDLYYRLFVCPVDLPPLRVRPNDVEVLFAHFWQRRGEHRTVQPAVLEHLKRYTWPGNVRELENVIERLAVCSPGPVIGVDDLPLGYRASPSTSGRARLEIVRDAIHGADAPNAPTFELPDMPLPIPGRMHAMNLGTLLREIESTYIDAALRQTNGNRQAAASLLGLQRTTLVEKLRRRQPSARTGDATADATTTMNEIGTA